MVSSSYTVTHPRSKFGSILKTSSLCHKCHSQDKTRQEDCVQAEPVASAQLLVQLQHDSASFSASPDVIGLCSSARRPSAAKAFEKPEPETAEAHSCRHSVSQIASQWAC